MARYQYTSDGFLAIPVSAFGTEYVIAAYPQYTAAGSIYDLPSVSNIIAAYDDTEVSFTMGGTNGSRTTGGLRKGQKATVTMMKGDVWCFADAGDAQDISGSLVKANKPIGVVSGNQCANVPAGVPWCDVTNEMELPTFTWGKELHVTPIVGRQKAPVIRVFAKEKDTRVYRDGKDWMRLTLNSRGEGDAFIERRAFDGDLSSVVAGGGTPCKVISADKPIYVMLYNPGQADDNIESDPFQMVLTPLEQYQKEIVFATPNAKGGSLPFTRQFVNLVYENTPDGAVPDDLEFATVANGKFTWKRVNVQFGPSPGYKFAVPIRGKNYSMKRLQLNGDGVFRIRAASPFAAYAYGFASYDSYGFPTSVALGDLEKKDTVKPNPEWKQLCDGSVVGKDGTGTALVTDKPDDVNVRSNLALIYMDLDSSYNYEFDYDKNREFIAGTTIKTDWSLKVIDPATDARGMLVFVDRAGNDTIIDIMYKAFSVDIEAKDTDFGKCKPGETITKSIDLVNKNKNSAAVVKNLTLKSGGQGFTILNATFPLTIPAGGKVTLQVSFKSDAKGEFRDAFLMDDGCVIAEKGTVKAVVGEPIIYVSEIDFGTIKKGTKVVQPLIVRNEGDAELTITGYSLPKDPAVFKLLSWPAISAQTPLVLKPGESRQLDVEFTAVDALNYADAIVFTSDARTRDSIGELKGKGIEGGLLARGADWGRKRIANGPYMDSTGIVLENIGNGPIRVIQSSAPNAVFAFDKNIFNGVTLQPGEVKKFEAAFSPTVIGDDKLTVTFETDMGTTVPTDPPLRGAGIIGQLQTQDYNFDSTIVQGVVKPINRKMVRITNIGTTDANGGDFSDDVELKELIVVTSGTISETNASYGTQGFKYDKAALNLPRILKKGEYVEFQAEFQAQKAGAAVAELQTESDASNSVTSKWTGWGIDPFRPDPKIEATGGIVKDICIGSSGDIIANVKNTGNVPFPVLGVVIADPTFKIDAASAAALTGTKLDLNETRSLKITYTPIDKTVRTAQLAIIGPTSDDTVYVDVTGIGTADTTYLEVVGKSGIVIGSKTSVVIKLKTAPSAVAAAKSMPLTLTYDPKVFSPILPEITTINGYVIKSSQLVKEGEINLTVEASTGLIDKAGEIATIPMNVYLPNYGKQDFEIGISGASIGCLTVMPGKGPMQIDPTCAFNYRGVDPSSQAFSLKPLSPNPVIAGKANVEFSVGFTVNTEIALYSMKGERVATLANGSYQKGMYASEVPFDMLPSGSYVIKMVAGPFTAEQQITISK
ncbi:MAG: choice-of-anchor D domain-containing protein, partial [Bacteroidota bacterium]